MIDPLSAPPPGRLPVQDDPGEFDFQQSSRATHSEHSVPPGGVPRALREAAEAQGIDPVAELYNEALRYAQEGHLRLARERLQMLLCMAPDDGQARLLLAQVHVAGQRWSDALSALDEAAECGIEVPLSLRRAVEDHIHAEKVLAEEQRNATRAREQGEVKTLRLEVRRLRGENTAHVAQIANLEREVRKWASVTASVCVLVSVFILGSLVYRHFWAAPEPVAEVPAEVVPEPGLVPAPVPEGGEPAPPAPPPIRIDPVVAAQQALASNKALEGTQLQVRLQQDRLVLTGDVVSFKQRKLAERLLGTIEGISGVDATAVRLLARTQGTTHRVEKGDTLSHLAHIYYGDSRLTDPIVQANHIKDAVLRLDDVVVIPALRE
jgi:nucleoid-associated protein YgaU